MSQPKEVTQVVEASQIRKDTQQIKVGQNRKSTQLRPARKPENSGFLYLIFYPKNGYKKHSKATDKLNKGEEQWEFIILTGTK